MASGKESKKGEPWGSFLLLVITSFYNQSLSKSSGEVNLAKRWVSPNNVQAAVLCASAWEQPWPPTAVSSSLRRLWRCLSGMSPFKESFSKAEVTTCLLDSLDFDWDMCTWTAYFKDQVEQRCERPTQAALDSLREKISVHAGSTHWTKALAKPTL